jgi:hypothetical protein
MMVVQHVLSFVHLLLGVAKKSEVANKSKVLIEIYLEALQIYRGASKMLPTSLLK